MCTSGLYVLPVRGGSESYALICRPYWVRHFRSGREGRAFEANAAGDRIRIFFPVIGTSEWRWASAFERQEPSRWPEVEVTGLAGPTMQLTPAVGGPSDSSSPRTDNTGTADAGVVP